MRYLIKFACGTERKLLLSNLGNKVFIRAKGKRTAYVVTPAKVGFTCGQTWNEFTQEHGLGY